MRVLPSSILSVVALASLCAVPNAAAQSPARDTLRLGELHRRAELADPRTAQLDQLAGQTRLRQETLSRERLPSLTAESQAQYQSDVTQFPLTFPGGAAPAPPHDTYDARLVATERLYDPSLGPRRAVERAQTAQSTARVRVSLFGARQQVNDAFFTALRAQEQSAELRAALTDLEAQRSVAATRVREGTALPSEEIAIRAELLRRRQALAESEVSRRAALAVLADLTDTPADSATTLAVPDLAAEVANARAAIGTTDLRARPEYEQFARSREVLEAQERVSRAQELPRLSAFGRGGYGRPGLNPLNTTFDSYWLAGVMVQWTPFTWGTTRRDREVLALQRRMTAADEAAFTAHLRRAVTLDVAAIERIEASLATDDDIIALRERIAAETRLRFAEAAVTSAEYVDRQTDVLSARTARAIHRVELAQARARFLNTLGIEVR